VTGGAADHVARISVVLCTYNGAQFLQCQLDSLLTQTVLPDELIVSDDGSSDETRQIVTQFEKKAPFQVRWWTNDVRLGAAQNFGHAVTLASGDLIALCDQDDQWLPAKLAEADQRFRRDPRLEAVFSDGLVVDSKLESAGYTLWQHVGISGSERARILRGECFEVLLKHVAVTGATLTIRNSLLSRALPIPPGWMHDAWFALIAAASSNLTAIPSALIRYRQHDSNEIGARHKSLAERWYEATALNRESYYGGEIARYRAAKQRLERFPNEFRPDAIEILDGKLRHLDVRANLPASRLHRIIPILRELGAQGYRRYSFGWQVAMKDLLIPGKVT